MGICIAKAQKLYTSMQRYQSGDVEMNRNIMKAQAKSTRKCVAEYTDTICHLCICYALPVVIIVVYHPPDRCHLFPSFSKKCE